MIWFTAGTLDSLSLLWALEALRKAEGSLLFRDLRNVGAIV